MLVRPALVLKKYARAISLASVGKGRVSARLGRAGEIAIFVRIS